MVDFHMTLELDQIHSCMSSYIPFIHNFININGPIHFQDTQNQLIQTTKRFRREWKSCDSVFPLSLRKTGAFQEQTAAPSARFMRV